MFERNSYLQKRAALHNLGFMRKLAALKSAALGVTGTGFQKGIAKILKAVREGRANNLNWGKVLANATPEQRFLLRQHLGSGLAKAKGGDAAILNDFTRANRTVGNILKQDYNRGVALGPTGGVNVFRAKDPNDLTGGYRNIGELGKQTYRDTFTANQNGGLVYWNGRGTPINPMKDVYSKPNGFYMPMVTNAGTQVLQGMDPTMARRLHQWYRSPEGMEYLKNHGMGKPGIVNNQSVFIPQVPEDINIMSMNEHTRNFALQQAQMNETLRQQQAMAQTNQQMNGQAGGSAVAGGKKDPTFSDRLTGFATLGGLGFGIPWAIGAFGRSDVPVGTADYDPARYYT